jgi:hypothetical protein
MDRKGERKRSHERIRFAIAGMDTFRDHNSCPLLVVAGAACFIRIADWVTDREIQGFDERVLSGLRSEATSGGADRAVVGCGCGAEYYGIGQRTGAAVAGDQRVGISVSPGKHHAMGFLVVCVIGV